MYSSAFKLLIIISSIKDCILSTSTNSKYTLHDDNIVTWDSAFSKCKEHRMRLATLRTITDYNDAKAFLEKEKNPKTEKLKNGVWIGLRLNTSSSGCSFTWTDGSTYTNYENLFNQQDGRCVKLNWITLELGSTYCTLGRNFLCEIMGEDKQVVEIDDFGDSTECAITTAATITTATTSVASTTSPTESEISSTVSTIRTTCRCPCNKVGDPAVKNMTVAQTLIAVKQLKQELMVDKTKLSSTKRKKISAPDDRSSSKGIGVIGVIILVGILCMLVIGDAPVLVRDFKTGLVNIGILKQDVQNP